jgi:hypothetical protein
MGFSLVARGNSLAFVVRERSGTTGVATLKYVAKGEAAEQYMGFFAACFTMEVAG